MIRVDQSRRNEWLEWVNLADGLEEWLQGVNLADGLQEWLDGINLADCLQEWLDWLNLAGTNGYSGSISRMDLRNG